MSDIFDRQIGLLRLHIRAYRKGELSLNSLIQKIEGISSAINTKTWGDATYPIVLEMEQVNAGLLSSKRNISKMDTEVIENALIELENLINSNQA